MQIAGCSTRSNARGQVKRDQDLRTMVDHLRPENLFANDPGRAHGSFKNCVLFTGTSQPAKLRASLQRHTNNLARQKELAGR